MECNWLLSKSAKLLIDRSGSMGGLESDTIGGFNDRAEKVLFVIITDGQENASREYSAERIKRRIERQKEKYGWEFIFFGANMDAVMEAGKLGISADRAQNYCADAIGTSVAYTAMSAFSTAYRGGKP